MKDKVPLQPPVEDLHEQWSDDQIQALQHQLGPSIIGNPDAVKEKLQKFLDMSQADESWRSLKFMIIKNACVPMKFCLISQNNSHKNPEFLNWDSGFFHMRKAPDQLKTAGSIKY